VKSFLSKSLLAGLFLCVAAPAVHSADPGLVWPTPNDAFWKREGLEAFIQPTPGNTVSSGLFGGVRNNGYRFHEGLDMKSVQRDRRNRVIDQVTAALPGTVAYINKIGGNSSYGRYVVLEHEYGGLNFYTLYAHLNSIQYGLAIGQTLPAGGKIGIMGRSATYNIPDYQTHLHFEIGLRLTNNFQSWYDWVKLGGPNYHGMYNGANLLATDPLPIFVASRDSKFTSYKAVLAAIPRAFSLRIYTPKVPELVRRSPALLTKPVPAEGVVAWDVEFSWYAMPLSFTPRTAGEVPARKVGEIRVLGYSKPLIEANKSRSTLIFEGNTIRYGKYLLQVIQLVFGLRNA